jgi:predicted transcriptional regulator
MVEHKCRYIAKKGYALSKYEIRKIVELLTSTEMTTYEIASRMGCSQRTVVNINREYQVRKYAGRRKWSPSKA